jgi:hypothetical protein
MADSVFSIYFMGAEQSGWRKLLQAAGAQSVGTSYYSLRKRLPKTKPLDMSEWGFARVLLDSGGYTANSNPGKHTLGEWQHYGREYGEWALAHQDEVSLVTEFDCNVLGRDWIERQRREVWCELDPAKFVPVWHAEDGIQALQDLADRFANVGVVEETLESGGGLNVIPHLNSLARRGVRIHGIAMTKPNAMRQAELSSAGSTSWLSPMRFGDTQVWHDGQFTRYPARMKEQARTRHRATFLEAGFDADKIQADDGSEVTAFALWSWLRLEESTRSLRTNYGPVVEADRTNSDAHEGGDPNVATGGQVVEALGAGRRNDPLVRAGAPLRQREALKTLPLLGTRDVPDEAEGAAEGDTVQVLEIRGTSARRCDTCAIRDACEEFEPGTTCAFSIPVHVRTVADRQALMTGLIELQTGRVAFGAHVEQVRGGYPDANVSQEFDRLLKAFQVQAELEDDRDFFEVTMRGKGGGAGGVMSALFGASPPARGGQRMTAPETERTLARVIDGERATGR